MGLQDTVVPFRQRFCRARDCGARFFLCRACDRGQCYCSAACRRSARTIQRRAARQRHQCSPAGRLDHRDRQRAYRRRLAVRRHAEPGATPTPTAPLSTPEKNVTDHASHAPVVSGTVRASAWCWPLTAPLRQRGRGLFVCHWCGRAGYWLNPFVPPG
ncbi:MAG: hypothetical protein JNM09_26375 [Blastocatellia bacterium]|nr:hypothetical protein [Blastocatellia bacterium]